MPRKTKSKAPRVPSLRHFKPSDIGFVELPDHTGRPKRKYLGKWGEPATTERYHQVVAEWLANGKRLPKPDVDPADLSVTELCAAFMRHAQQHYRQADGTTSSQLSLITGAMRDLERLYGSEPAAELGPVKLRTLRETWIGNGWARTTVNRYACITRLIFKWGASHELIPASVYHALVTVEGLKAGRCAARETEPVKPVPDAHIRAARRLLPMPVRALVDLQLLTGARAGELVGLKATDLDTSGPVWIASLARHKSAHKGKTRKLYFGPRAQRVLRLFLRPGRPLAAPLFDPHDAIAERAAETEVHRRPDQKPNVRQTERRVRDAYDTGSYGKCITRACKDAGVPGWSPHRLRHNAGTALRRQFGLELAGVMLGHARCDVTEIYAEVNEARALEIARKVG